MGVHSAPSGITTCTSPVTSTAVTVMSAVGLGWPQSRARVQPRPRRIFSCARLRARDWGPGPGHVPSDGSDDSEVPEGGGVAPLTPSPDPTHRRLPRLFFWMRKRRERAEEGEGG